jgi:hypothetical protein
MISVLQRCPHSAFFALSEYNTNPDISMMMFV